MSTDPNRGKAILEQAEAEGWKQFTSNPVVALALTAIPASIRPVIEVICKLAIMTGALATADIIARNIKQEQEKH